MRPLTSLEFILFDRDLIDTLSKIWDAIETVLKTETKNWHITTKWIASN